MEFKTKVAGRYKIEVGKSRKERRVVADWFSNLILNQGLDYIGNRTDGDWMDWCQVGSGSGAPANADVSLDSFVESTDDTDSDTGAVVDTEPDDDSAYAVTLTPAATTGASVEFTLGSGSWADADVDKTITNISAGEDGIATIISIDGAVATCEITENFTDTNAIASGDWELKATLYFWYREIVYSFGQGDAEGNLSEVGVGIQEATGGLFSRALILDGEGDPTTITVLSDEYLYVTYEIRRYVSIVDVTGTVTLRGIVHDYVGRPAEILTEPDWLIPWYADDRTSDNSDRAYDGTIGSITEDPSGNEVNITENIPDTNYESGDYYLDWLLTIPVDKGNLNNYISAIKVFMSDGIYQFGFSPDIEKTSDDQLTLTFRISWGRK